MSTPKNTPQSENPNTKKPPSQLSKIPEENRKKKPSKNHMDSSSNTSSYSENEKEQKPEKKNQLVLKDLIAENFVTLTMIGKGAFGQIYLSYDMRDNIEVSIKKEIKKPQKTPQLRTEAKLYQSLLNISSQDITGAKALAQDDIQGVAHFYGMGELIDSYYLIIEFLGPNLIELFNYCGYHKFTISTVSLIALQMINRIEYIHKHHYIHRDIKPENFLIGSKEKANIIYLLDFGLSKRYKNPKNHQHIPYREGRPLTGTARYVSINTHLGIEQSRRDDLESIGYVLIFFLKGCLPWQGLKAGVDKYQRIMEKKLQIPTEILCFGLPDEIIFYLNYCKSLRFEDRPDYDYLRSLFIKLLTMCNTVYGLTKDMLKFDWSFRDPSTSIWQIFNKKNKGIVNNNSGNLNTMSKDSDDKDKVMNSDNYKKQLSSVNEVHNEKDYFTKTNENNPNSQINEDDESESISNSENNFTSKKKSIENEKESQKNKQKENESDSSSTIKLDFNGMKLEEFNLNDEVDETLKNIYFIDNKEEEIDKYINKLLSKKGINRNSSTISGDIISNLSKHSGLKILETSNNKNNENEKKDENKIEDDKIEEDKKKDIKETKKSNLKHEKKTMEIENDENEEETNEIKSRRKKSKKSLKFKINQEESLKKSLIHEEEQKKSKQVLSETDLFDKSNLEILNNKNQLNMKVSKENIIKIITEPISKYYLIISDLGHGSYGQVKKVRHRQLNEIRAMKITNKKSESSKSEIEILRKISHPNITNVYEIFEDSKKYYIMMEYLQGGELFEAITKAGSFSEFSAGKIMKQLLAAVNYLHNNNIVHRDLKPENIMLTSEPKEGNYEIKLIDFGAARQFIPGKKIKKFIGTSYYIAPEVLKENYDEKCDVWSCGVILYILLCGYPPFNGNTNIDIYHNIQTQNPNFSGDEWEDITYEAITLIKNMLNKNPNKRYSIDDCLKHKWFSLLDDNEKNLGSKSHFKQIQYVAISHMAKFIQENRFKKAVLQFISNQFDIQKEEGDLREIFKSLDTSGKGQLDQQIFTDKLIELYGENDGKVLGESIFANLDLDGSGKISYDEFLSAMINSKKVVTDERLEKAFKIFDKDHNGKLSVDEIISVFGGNKESWKKVISEIDLNKDGEVDFNEFKIMMTNIDKNVGISNNIKNKLTEVKPSL